LYRNDTSAFDGKKIEQLDRKGMVNNKFNVTAGSICKRLGLEEGQDLNPPTFEFFLKNDDLGDPMINEFHIRSFD